MLADIDEQFKRLSERYARAHPASLKAIQQAAQWLPGGNTRTVLHYSPFPMVITSGRGSRVVDLDGHEYIDCVGEFSAGLYGHATPEIQQAIAQAVNGGLTLGGPNLLEAELAQNVCERFSSVERVRFCNSGTEANLFAVAAARAITGRSRVLVFEGAYHGGVMTFPTGGNKMNVPFDWLFAPYNNIDATRSVLQNKGDSIAAILVEPILGAAGNIPGTREFLQMLRDEASRCGAVLIFDEVKTSRCGPGGVQGLTGVVPDMTTLGKYLGGGMPLGAFGGRRDIMDHFDPTNPHGLKHAGTFNNNVVSLSAGLAGLTKVFTASCAQHFHDRTESFKKALGERFSQAGLPVHLTGHGSMFTVHFSERAPENAADVSEKSVAMRRLMLLLSIESGVRLAGRGDVYLSLAMTDADLAHVGNVLFESVRTMFEG